MERNFFLNIEPNTQNVFLQNGFWTDITPGVRLHKHNYSEIHVVSSGEASFAVGEEVFCLCDGDLLLIPRKTLHSCIEQTEDLLHTAFQIDLPAERSEIHSLPPAVVREFFKQIQSAATEGDYRVISSYISLFCGYLKKDESLLPQPIEDDAFLIQEYFSHHYAEDVRLSDLASYLHRSERQAERLIVAHTGHTFREELTLTRVGVAKNLLESTDLPLQKIAEYVGYHSYAGFWKAMKKYG